MPSPEAILADLVAFPTVSSEPVTAIADRIATRCEDAGMRVERYETSPGKCNLVCSAGPRAQENRDGVILSGHMDVVPVIGQPWTSDPFTLTRRGDNLHGRGSCDMKAFIAAILHALPSLPLKRLKNELVLAFTHDEETGCHGSRALVERLAEEGRPVPRACLIGEPTSLTIFRMHPGHSAAQIVCLGKAAHSSKPDLGRSAIALAGRVLIALETVAEDWSRRPAARPGDAALLDRPFVVLNVGMIRGGSAINIVPDHCTIEIGFRPLPGMDVEELMDEIRGRVAEVAHALHRKDDVQVTLQRVTPAMLTPEGTALEGLLRGFARSPKPLAASFATDGGNLERLGVQTLVFGPGSIDVAHQADEYVPIAELHRAVNVVEAVVGGRCA
ncbi:MAG: acetylornithine deacetylase [Myxococcales bacterium]|nr:acetylornithine deacetylase [Myxococcales bacterium]